MTKVSVSEKNDITFFFNSKWLLLPYISLFFTFITTGLIAAISQGDPEPIVQQWGITDFGIFAIFLHSIGMSIAVLILYRVLRKNLLSLKVYFPNRLSSKAVIWVLCGSALAFTLYPLVEVFSESISLPMYWGQSKQSHLVLGNTFSVILSFIGAVALASIMEEIIFRGFLYSFFKQRNLSSPKCILFSILIFTSVHVVFGPGMMIYILIWSIIPFILYMKFKSLYASILFHFINNFLAYILLPLCGL